MTIWTKNGRKWWLQCIYRLTTVRQSSFKLEEGKGVPVLNVANSGQHYMQSYKVEEAKMADSSRTARSQKTAHPSRSAYSSVLIQWFCPCHPFVAVALTQFEVSPTKRFSLFTLAEDGKKREKICLATVVRVRYLRSLQNLLIVFSYLGALTSLLFWCCNFNTNAHRTRQSHWPRP